MINGVLLINKPEGITSFSVVNQIRRQLGRIKCGHSGTLDPMASGLLPVLLGKATKLSNYITSENKAYFCKMKFGILTDTFDITGNILKTDNAAVSESDIKKVLPSFLGEIEQTPPIYSAIKVNGTPLYKHARNNTKVDIPKRKVEIYNIKFAGFDKKTKELCLDVKCSKGTYIRSLCVDIAKSLGTIASMSYLDRYQNGNFLLTDAIKLDEALSYINEGTIENYILNLDRVLDAYPKYYVNEFYSKLLINGCEIDISKLKGLPENICRVYCDQLLGLGSIISRDDGRYFKLTVHLK